MNKVGFIGAGNMATAIISGITKAKMNVELYAYDVDFEKASALAKFQVHACNSILEMVKDIDFLFLSVKPQNFSEVLTEIKGHLSKYTVIVSIAAGITQEYIATILGFDVKVVRVMPNTPLLLGFGASALSHNSQVTADEFNFVQQIFNSAGISEVVSPDKMNEVIAINGSTPAFIYEFARCFIEYGKSVDLDEKVCLNLFSQTLIGSAKMMMESGYTIEELIQMVSSKGGTTIAGLESFKDSGLQDVVTDACKKCVNRAYELSK
ncbi:pyrroline-5-carboxylate reductase [Paludicola sp. MB14-C6]|uniref:pyrroline-5-carboxylate reductase n=1 Tax=Paludihabitans sp. MB14-C6 TaxID=3070656 RepID=UPI0027DCB1F1|nr:pyrroline-5-carboxylate reductase [Paludicola sp. MB14-C6]WMJ23126.1 pyrroline-5-carboxylate reductase [Paludicola sp. MB14-C6]